MAEAVKINPVTDAMVAMRDMVVDRHFFTGVWVAGLMMGVLLVAATWVYRGHTA